jgi:membrane fusion protein, multidrug efflux system
MADRDPQIDMETAQALESKAPLAKRLRKYGLMLLVPLLLIGGAAYYYKSNENFVSTDNAYVQQAPKSAGESSRSACAKIRR